MIHICIPAHNEARTLGPLLWKLRSVFLEFGRDFEVLVLDDASTDRTPEVLASYASLLPLHVIRVESPLGHGAAVERLLRESEGRTSYPKRDVAVVLQADFTERPEDLVDMVKAIEGGSDLVTGVPDDEVPGEVPRAVRLSRWAAPWVLGRAYRTAPVKDPLSGLRAYRIVVLRKAFRASDVPLVSEGRDGWAANLELLSRTVPHARRVDETPYRPRWEHRTRPTRFQGVGTLKSLLPLRRVTWPEPSSEDS